MTAGAAGGAAVGGLLLAGVGLAATAAQEAPLGRSLLAGVVAAALSGLLLALARAVRGAVGAALLAFLGLACLALLVAGPGRTPPDTWTADEATALGGLTGVAAGVTLFALVTGGRPPR